MPRGARSARAARRAAARSSPTSSRSRRTSSASGAPSPRSRMTSLPRRRSRPSSSRSIIRRSAAIAAGSPITASASIAAAWTRKSRVDEQQLDALADVARLAIAAAAHQLRERARGSAAALRRRAPTCMPSTSRPSALSSRASASPRYACWRITSVNDSRVAAWRSSSPARGVRVLAEREARLGLDEVARVALARRSCASAAPAAASCTKSPSARAIDAAGARVDLAP